MAADELLGILYDELRTLASQKMARENTDQTLQATALVHEAWLRLGGDKQPAWRNRAHFFAAAAEAMRCILVDHYRRKHAVKRGGYGRAVDLAEAEYQASTEWKNNMVALDEALTKLASMDNQQARIVELRFFGGLSIEETAEVVGVSPATVKSRWSLARVWLRRELRGK